VDIELQLLYEILKPVLYLLHFTSSLEKEELIQAYVFQGTFASTEGVELVLALYLEP